MNEFLPIPGRDAHTSIRGFYYQALHTVHRWLTLSANDRLVLECGEDIDIILSANSPTPQRVLEQIKSESKRLTLNTASAQDAIANAHYYRENNPGQDLLFRYITTSEVGKESKSHLPPNLKGIEVWQELHQNDEWTVDANSLVVQLHRTIREAVDRRAKRINTKNGRSRQPAVIPNLSRFLSTTTPQGFLSLAKAFEWSTGALDPETIKNEIISLLKLRPSINDDSKAEIICAKLFLSVFSILSKSGPKELSPKQRDELTCDASFDSSFEALKETLESRFSALERRINGLAEELNAHKVADRAEKDNLEKRLSTVESSFISLTHNELELPARSTVPAPTPVSPSVSNMFGDATLGTFAASVGLKGEHAFSAVYYNFSPPPALEKRVERTETVSDLVKTLKSSRWLALIGDVGSGKTQIVLSMCRLQESPVKWVRLRGRSQEETLGILNALLSQAQTTGSEQQRSDSLLPGTSIILDDLPRLLTQDLIEQLVNLFECAVALGARIISTSHWELPQELLSLLPAKATEQRSCPRFSISEVQDALLVYGAPNQVSVGALAKFLHRLTEGHPALAIAAIRYAQSVNWSVQESEMRRLVQGGYAAVIQGEVKNAVERTVPDPDSRRFLYRLTVPVRSFGSKEVETIAQVEQTISRPMERLDDLLGLWVEHDGERRWATSPLIKTFGRSHLVPSELRQVHERLARLIWSQGKLTTLDVVTAITHFIAAECYDAAAALNALAFDAIAKGQLPPVEYRWLRAFTDASLPNVMSLHAKLFLRGKQLAAVFAVKDDPTSLMSELRQLLHEGIRQNSEIVPAVALMCGPVCPVAPPIWSNEMFLLAINNFPHVPPDYRPSGSLEAQVNWLIWHAAAQSRSTVEFRSWIDTYDALPVERQKAACEGEIGLLGALHGVDSLWHSHWLLPQSDQNWLMILGEYERLQTIAHEKGWQYIEMCALRARSIITGEQLGDYTSAIAMVRLVQAGFPDSAIRRFLLDGVIGRELLYAKRYEEATESFKIALADTFPELELERFWTLRDASRAAASIKETATARLYLEEALGIEPPEKSESNDLESWRSLGELAIIHWMEGSVEKALDAFGRLLDYLLSDKSPDVPKKDFLVRIGHVLGYITTTLTTKFPPKQIENAEEYTPPFPGIFSRDPSIEVANRFHPELQHFLMMQLAMAEEAIHRDDKATLWMVKAYESAKNRSNPSTLGSLSHFAVNYLLLSERVDDAISLIRAAAYHAALNSRHIKESGSALSPWGEQDWSSVSKKELEATAGWIHWLFLVPTVFFISKLLLVNGSKAEQSARSIVQSLEHESAIAPDLLAVSQMMIDAISDIFLRKLNQDELYDRGLKANKLGHTALAASYYIGASLSETTNLRKTIQLQIVPMETILKSLRLQPSVIRQLIVPFIEEFWIGLLNKGGFLFTNAAHLRSAFASLGSIQGEERLKRILKEVALDLGGYPVGQAADWLRSG